MSVGSPDKGLLIVVNIFASGNPRLFENICDVCGVLRMCVGVTGETCWVQVVD